MVSQAQLHDLVEVTWVDHTLHVGPYNRGAHGLTVRQSSGYLVMADNDLVIIAQTKDRDGSYEDCMWLAASLVLDISKVVRKK